MKLRYEQLFNIDFTAAYYVDARPHEDFVMMPTNFCKKQMSRFSILYKKIPGGLSLLYECSPFTNDATPFKPIIAEEKFVFKVSVTNPDAWYYSDINGWGKDKVYILKNPFFNAPGNINILTGPLNTPILFRPMEFKYELQLDNVQALLEIRDTFGNLIKVMRVRAKTSAEPVGKKESYFVNLKNYADGLYTLRHISSGGTVDEEVYCTVDYEPGILAIVEITYKTGLAWTGVAPFQKYIINISSRLTEWFIDVNIRKKTVPTVVASDLAIKHIPMAPEPLRTFKIVGAADDVNGFVQFKSVGTISYSQKPMHLQLVKAPAVSILDPVPLPSSISLQKNSLNILFTKIIVNI